MVVTEIARKRMIEAQGEWRPEDFSKRLEVIENRIIVYSDMHIPYHDVDLFIRLLETAKREKIEAIVLLGDTWDMKQFGSYGDDTPSHLFSTAKSIGKEVIDLLLESHLHVYISPGNHDMRWIKKNNYQCSFHDMCNLMGIGDDLIDPREGIAVVTVSESPAWDAVGNTLLVHPEKYGSNPLVEPSKLALKFDKNVISGHAHHWGLTKMVVGEKLYHVCESGGGFDARFFKYVQYTVSSMKGMVSGYCTLIDGHISLYD